MSSVSRLVLVTALIFRLALHSALVAPIVESVPHYTQPFHVGKDDMRYQLGKDKLESFEREGKMPRYGACWLNAVESLKSGCKELTEDIQHWLAFKFANCFLMKTGKVAYECEEGVDIGSCTAKMNTEAYQVLTEFFTHTQNMCFFLHSQIWHENTERIVTHLASSSDQIAVKLDNSGELQTRILEKQNETFNNQERMIANAAKLEMELLDWSDKLGQSIEESRNSVRSIVNDFQNMSAEQKLLVTGQNELMAKVYNRIKSLQSLVVGEFTGIYSVVFYVCMVVVVYLMTATPRTSGARFWLFLFIALNFAVERVIVAWSTSIHGDPVESESSGEMAYAYSNVLNCRMVFLFLDAVIYVWTAYHFKDYNRINNQLLVKLELDNRSNHQMLNKITEENLELKTLLKSVIQDNKTVDAETDSDVGRVPPAVRSTGRVNATVPNPRRKYRLGDVPPLPIRCSTPLVLDRRSSGYDTFSSSQDSYDSSSSSGESDHTYVQKDDKVDSSWNSSLSSRSRESTPCSLTRESTPGLFEELKELRESTPFKELTSFINSSFESVSNENLQKADEKLNNSSAASNTKSVTPTTCPYNLRSRARKLPSTENPMVDLESPESFGHHVKHLANVAARNRVKVMATVKRLQINDELSSASDTPSSRSSRAKK